MSVMPGRLYEARVSRDAVVSELQLSLTPSTSGPTSPSSTPSSSRPSSPSPSQPHTALSKRPGFRTVLVLRKSTRFDDYAYVLPITQFKGVPLEQVTPPPHLQPDDFLRSFVRINDSPHHASRPSVRLTSDQCNGSFIVLHPILVRITKIRLIGHSEGGAAIPITDIHSDDLKRLRKYCDEVEQRMISSSSESEGAADSGKDEDDGDTSGEPSSQQANQTHSTSTTYPTRKSDAEQAQGSDTGSAMGGRQVLNWEEGWGSDLESWWRKPNAVELSEVLTGEGMWGGYEGYKAWYAALREPLTLEVFQ